MTNTFFRNNFNEVVKGQAYGYARDGAGFRLSVTNFDTAGATSLMTTVEDLAKWHANFDSGAVGGQTMLAALLTRGVLNDRRVDRLRARHQPRHVSRCADGRPRRGGRGLSSGVPAVPGAGLRRGGAVQSRLRESDGCSRSGWPTCISPTRSDRRPRRRRPDDTPEVPVSAAELQAVAGLYWNAAELIQRRFVFQDGKLHAVTPALVAMKPIGGGRFVTTVRARLCAWRSTRRPRPIRVTVTLPSGPIEHLERAEPYAPSAAALAEFAGTYRSEEIDPAYRLVVRDGTLRLERLKAAPATLAPLVTDTFTSPIGIIRFTRDSAGRVTGFVLDGGRIKRMKFAR